MNVLMLYNSTQTYTNAVFEHVSSFGKYSSHRVFYTHADPISELNIDLKYFDAIGIHYSIRLPFDQISPSVDRSLHNFDGLKFLFIQDEYDFPMRAWHWIRKLNIQLVFTVVPEAGIETVYPKAEFQNTRFVTNLTGYAPEKLPPTLDLPKPSERKITVGYRARKLPIRYGSLGVEKVSIGQNVKSYLDNRNIQNDIAWTEESRIYGRQWYDFVVSCRSMLGSESGSNVFDWDGTIGNLIREYLAKHPNASDDDLYGDIIKPREIDGLMNQVSPRVFEAIASRTALILFEGNYSGVVLPGVHFIPLKKDFSNLDEVVRLLQDTDFIDNMADRAWQDVIASGKYSYKVFVDMVDFEIKKTASELVFNNKIVTDFSTRDLSSITTRPIRAHPPRPSTDTIINTVIGSDGPKDLTKRIVIYMWLKLPETIQKKLRQRLKRIFGKG